MELDAGLGTLEKWPSDGTCIWSWLEWVALHQKNPRLGGMGWVGQGQDFVLSKLKPACQHLSSLRN